MEGLDRRIVRLAVPALGSIAAEPLYNLADTALVGHLGRLPLDSLAIATSALAIVAWLSIFLATATTSAVARLAAARNTAAAGRAVGAAYAVAAAWGAIVAILVVIAAPLIAVLLGGHGAAAAGAVGYLRASAAGLPFLYLSYAGNGHMIGMADTRTPLRIAVSANVLNVAGESALLFGAHTGLVGSAWGTVAAQVTAAAWYALASWRRAAVRPRRPGAAEIGALLRDGHRLSVRTVALGVVPLAATAVVARLGPVTLAGQQVAYRLWYMLSLSLDALAVPAQVFVSSAIGSGDPEAARRTGRRTLRLGLLTGCVFGLVTAALALGAPDVFTSDAAVRHAAVTGLLVSALTQPLAALAFVLDGLILGIADYAAMRRAMILAILAFAPMAALTARFHRLGLPGIWAALALWLAARSILLGRRWIAHVRAPAAPDPAAEPARPAALKHYRHPAAPRSRPAMILASSQYASTSARPSLEPLLALKAPTNAAFLARLGAVPAKSRPRRAVGADNSNKPRAADSGAGGDNSNESDNSNRRCGPKATKIFLDPGPRARNGRFAGCGRAGARGRGERAGAGRAGGALG